MNPIDRDARKQLLLTRIAFERGELRGELARVQRAARPAALMRGVFGADLVRSLFGSATGGSGGAPAGGWVGLALSLLRRYRVAAALIGGVAPILRGRGAWRRIVKLGSIAAAVYAGWRLAQRRNAA